MVSAHPWASASNKRLHNFLNQPIGWGTSPSPAPHPNHWFRERMRGTCSGSRCVATPSYAKRKSCRQRSASLTALCAQSCVSCPPLWAEKDAAAVVVLRRLREPLISQPRNERKESGMAILDLLCGWLALRTIWHHPAFQPAQGPKRTVFILEHLRTPLPSFKDL